MEEGSSHAPGQPALEKLAHKEPNVFEVRRAREDEKDEHGSRPYGVYVYTDKERKKLNSN